LQSEQAKQKNPGMDNGKNKPKSDNASKKKALETVKAKRIRSEEKGRERKERRKHERGRRRRARTYLYDTVEECEEGAEVEKEQPRNSGDTGISDAAYEI